MAEPKSPPDLVSRFVSLVVAGVGVLFISVVWSDDFGSAPLPFSLMMTLIASVFVVVGAAGVFGVQVASVRHGRRAGSGRRGERSARVGYQCPNCGAGLDADADVSPSGDVRCGYCNRWFNVHASG